MKRYTMTGFNVTFERWDEAAVEAGDTDDRGFIIEDVSLRDAVQFGLEYSRAHCEANEYPVRSPRWLTFYDWNEGACERFETGIIESRALHIPDHVTPASRRRIARLFGGY
jgi:hypothetical protein